MSLIQEKNDSKGKVIPFHFSNFEEMEELESKIKKQVGDDVFLLEKRNCKLSIIKRMLVEEPVKFLILEDADEMNFDVLKKIAEEKEITIII